jgi:RNA polymerase-associated protein
MTLYTGGVDPRSHWVRIAAAEKGLALRLVESDPLHPPEDLIDLNPYQTLPTLVDRDLVVYEPQVIGEYLDERFPHPPMLPGDPAGRAQARVALQRILHDWYGPADDLQAPDERRDAVRARRQLRESVLAAEPLFRLRPFFLSEQFSLLDAAVVPVLWRLPHWGIELPEDAVHLRRYAVRAFARLSFRLSLSEPERDMRS